MAGRVAVDSAQLISDVRSRRRAGRVPHVRLALVAFQAASYLA